MVRLWGQSVLIITSDVYILHYSCLQITKSLFDINLIVLSNLSLNIHFSLYLLHCIAYLLSSPLVCWRRQCHSSTLAWKIPWTEEPGRLQSMGSLRVRHDWASSLSLFTLMYWRRKWQPTPVFLPGESQGQGSLVGCHIWGCTESDMTEAT